MYPQARRHCKRKEVGRMKRVKSETSGTVTEKRKKRREEKAKVKRWERKGKRERDTWALVSAY